MTRPYAMNRTGDILLAIDQGTSSTRVIAFSPAGNVVAVEQQSFEQSIRVQPGARETARSRSETRFEPKLNAADRDRQIAGWRNALRRVRSV
jgi:glycerol kinase